MHRPEKLVADAKPSKSARLTMTASFLAHSSFQLNNMSTIRNLPPLVHKQFKAAQASGDLTFFETRVSILHCEGLPVCTCMSWISSKLLTLPSFNSVSPQLLLINLNQINRQLRSQLTHSRTQPVASLSRICFRPISLSSTSFP